MNITDLLTAPAAPAPDVASVLAQLGGAQAPNLAAPPAPVAAAPDLGAILAGFGGPPPAPVVAPTAPMAPQGRGGFLQTLMPMILAGVAAKQGGPLAAAAMLRGYTQASARKRAEELRLYEEALVQARSAEEQRRLTMQFQQTHRERAASFIADVTKSVGAITDPADRARAIEMYDQMGVASYGLPPGTITRMPLPPGATVDNKDRARAEAFIKQFKAARGQEFFDYAVAQNSLVPFTPGQPPVSIGSVLALAGTDATDAAGKPISLPAKPVDDGLVEGTGEFQNRVKAAMRVARQQKGSIDLTPEDVDAIMKRVGTEMNTPRDPLLRQLTQLQLNQMSAGDLPPQVQTRVQRIGDTFKTEQKVKEVQVQAEAYDFVTSLSNTSESSADDIGLIYAFAKAMDPNSVVREGEYATVQKYAQAWIESFGFNAARVVSNQEFLTPQARKNMKETIRKKYAAGKRQYDNLATQYAKRINQVTGRADGAERLTDYAAAFPSVGGPVTVTDPAGTTHTFETQAQADEFQRRTGAK